MPTLRGVILKHQQREDKSYNVKIRVTHNRASAYIATNHYVNANQLDDKFRIKENDPINNIVLSEIITYRQTISKMGYAINGYTAKDLADLLQEKEKENSERIDFLAFLKDHYTSMKEERRGAGWENYRATYNHLHKHTKGSLDFRGLTSNVLALFESYLVKQGVGGRGITLYMNCIRATFNEGRRQYNDDDLGIIKTPNYPFSRHSIPKIPCTSSN